MFDVFEDTTPLVEGLSIDEAFLDVGGLRRVAGTPVQIAARLRRRVAQRVGLPITVGVARTKFLAKVASGVAKPDGLLVVPPDGELAFLHPLPVERLWGVGRVTAAKLHDRGITTVGEVAALPEGALESMVGRGTGRHLYALAHNRDPRVVEVGRRRRSIGSQHALGRARRTPAGIDQVVVGLVDRVTRRMRAARRVGRTVMLRLRFGDFARATRSHTLPWRRPTRPRSCRRPGGWCGRWPPPSRPAGSRWSASRWATWSTTGPFSPRCRSTAGRARRSARRSTPSTSGSGRRR